MSRRDFKKRVNTYTELHGESTGAATRKENYETLVNNYYDLATDFYVFGWSQSFHFAARNRGESFKASLVRHERFLADELELRRDMHVLDLGCGVAGPMCELARYSGARLTGVNNNAYQVEKAKAYIQKARLERQCTVLKTDFMRIPLPDGTFDAAYAIEATVHAPDQTALFKELRRLLKPGSSLASYEWCLTERYDESNPEHRRIKGDIEKGTGLPDIPRLTDVPRALGRAGFQVLKSYDMAPASPVPWYAPLTGRDLSLRSLPRTPLGRAVTNVATRILVALRVAPRGTTEVSTFLNRGADALVEGGMTGVFTPMFYVLARTGS